MKKLQASSPPSDGLAVASSTQMSSRRYDKGFERRRWRIRRETRDSSVPSHGRAKTERVDLGLALLSAVAVPGVSYTYDEIAVWCGCTETNIFSIEQRALKKLRNALRFRDPGLGRELFTELFERRSPAAKAERMRSSI